jgi:hypothetical protein
MTAKTEGPPTLAKRDGPETSSFDGDDASENTPASCQAQESASANWLEIRRLAKRFGRPIKTLLALAPQNDPFYGGKAAQRDAAWFAELYKKHGFGTGVHLRRIHCVLVSQETPVKLRDGADYLNTVECWQKLCTASKAARYLELVPLDHFVDQRNAEAGIYLPDAPGGEPEVTVERGGIDIDLPEDIEPPYLPQAPVQPGISSYGPRKLPSMTFSCRWRDRLEAF